ncbi:RING-4 protein [Sarocladium implicatum]|nr:RING-4 protein [Sarocladium implicatum]
MGIASLATTASTGASVSNIAALASPMIVDYCTARFFERLHPTIPILTQDYVTELRATVKSGQQDPEAACVIGAMCAQVLLQADEPENLHRQGIIPDSNSDFAQRLLAAVMETHQTLPRTVSPSLELCLLTFFIYACQARLFHHGQAFLFLREATTLLLLFRRETERDQTARELADRLFWVLLISERSHAIRYRRPITLHITSETPQIDTSDPSLVGFWSLASLFRPIDTSFVSLLNRETFAIAPARESLAYVEMAVNTALRPTMELHDTQKANLRVTQLWLRIIIWQLRLHLGYLTEESQQSSLTYQYPVEVAKDLMLSTRDLPLDSIKVHGVGITEKLYDVASAVVDVLARIPLAASSSEEPTMGNLPEDALVYLKHLIARLPGGDRVYTELLEKHMSQAIPRMAVNTSPNR